MEKNSRIYNGRVKMKCLKIFQILFRTSTTNNLINNLIFMNRKERVQTLRINLAKLKIFMNPIYFDIIKKFNIFIHI